MTRVSLSGQTPGETQSGRYKLNLKMVPGGKVQAYAPRPGHPLTGTLATLKACAERISDVLTVLTVLPARTRSVCGDFW